MALTVVLAVCVDSTTLAIHESVWKSAGYIVTTAESIREAIERFKAGDFDLVLMGHSIAPENRERLTFLIRASGSRVPVASIGRAVGDYDTFTDATFGDDPNELLLGMGELMAKSAKMLAMRRVQNDLPAYELPRSA
jgi:DNA-binding response OmpR family regulator